MQNGTPFDVPGYEKLARILTAAYDQAARGKGKERHANDLPFHEQPILTITGLKGIGLGGPAFQVIKKTQEACQMVERGQLIHAAHELSGAIVYAAAMILEIERRVERDGDKSDSEGSNNARFAC